MNSSIDLNKVLTDALVILIPAGVAWLTAWLNGRKGRKDTDAAFKKLRAHEDHLGIETRIQGGTVYVSSRATSKNDPSQVPPGPSSQETSASGATPSG